MANEFRAQERLSEEVALERLILKPFAHCRKTFLAIDQDFDHALYGSLRLQRFSAGLRHNAPPGDESVPVMSKCLKPLSMAGDALCGWEDALLALPFTASLATYVAIADCRGRDEETYSGGGRKISNRPGPSFDT